MVDCPNPAPRLPAGYIARQPIGLGAARSSPVASGMTGPEDDSLLERMEQRAFENLQEEEDASDLDLLASLQSGAIEHPTEASDITLAGYIKLHNRPPAFEGIDGQPYTVDLDAEATADPQKPFAAFFVFIRWAATGAGIMDHHESGDVAFGTTDAEARAAASELTLYEIKAELDAAITRKQHDLEEMGAP